MSRSGVEFKGKGKINKVDTSTYPNFDFYEKDGLLEIHNTVPFEEIKKLPTTLATALATGKITSLDLSFFSLSFSPEHPDTTTNIQAELQYVLMGVIREYLKQPTCKLEKLNLNGWKTEDASHQGISNYYNDLLAPLGKALRNNTSLTSFSFEHSQLNAHNIKTFFAALYATPIGKLKTTETLEKGTSKLDCLELAHNISTNAASSTKSSKRSQNTTAASLADLQMFASKTGINIVWEHSPEPVKKDEASNAPRKEIPIVSQNKKDQKEEPKAAKNPEKASQPAAPKTTKTTSTDGDFSHSSQAPTYLNWLEEFSEQEEEVLTTNPSKPKREFLSYLGQAFTYGFTFSVIGAALGSTASLILMSVLPTTFTLLGLALTVSGVGLIGIAALAAIGLLVGIGVGLYQAHQDYKNEVEMYRDEFGEFYEEVSESQEDLEEASKSEEDLTNNSSLYRQLSTIINEAEKKENDDDELTASEEESEEEADPQTLNKSKENMVRLFSSSTADRPSTVISVEPTTAPTPRGSGSTND